MEEYDNTMLSNSSDEWTARLVTILTPFVRQGIEDIFKEAEHLCKQSHEVDQYLTTFQTSLSSIPLWSDSVLQSQVDLIQAKSNCKHLDVLISCVHINQLKLMTSARTSNKKKNIQLSVPDLCKFMHKIFINVGREMYKRAFLFQLGQNDIQKQKSKAKIEDIIRAQIMETVRQSVPTNELLEGLVDEHIEQEEEVITEEVIEPEPEEQPVKKQKVEEPLPEIVDTLEVVEPIISVAKAEAEPILELQEITDLDLVEPNKAVEEMQDVLDGMLDVEEL